MKSSIHQYAAALAICLAAFLHSPASARPEAAFSAVSPDGRNELRLDVGAGGMSYSVSHNGRPLVMPTAISLVTREHGRMDGRGATPSSTTRKVGGTIATPLYKKASVDLSANETRVDFGEWALVLHARNDGVAWRFETKYEGEITVTAENTDVVFPKGTALCYSQEGHFQTGWERPAKIGPVESVKPGHPHIVMTPFTATVPGAGVFSMTESDLLDYPGLNFYRRDGENDKLRSWQAGVPSKVDVGRRMTNVQKRHNYLAKTKGTRAFPWRVFVIGDTPSDLVSSDAVYALAEPSRVADFSWVKPGQVAWDWWNGFKITDVPGLKTGCNFETYKEYVNFAAANGIAYIIMDEGWAEKLDLDKPRDDVNVPGVIAYAKEKGVDVILWAAWAQLMDREKRLRVFDRYAAMGAKGFKIDFMNRDDQLLERFLEETAADAADRKLVVMYHGIHKPTGLCRTYPNVLNYEGVYGLEQGHSIGGRKVVVSNDVNLVYTRMIAGAMDYTPGAMRNRAFGAPDFVKGRDAPACYGTRCHQLALFPLFEAPVQMLCDSPTQYRTAPECTAFITKVPTVWDETVGVAGEIGKYAAVARRKGGRWWLGAITNWDPREIALPTDFLGGGEWDVEMFEDAPDADVNAEHYVRRTFTVKAGDTLKAKLAPGGGFAASFARRPQLYMAGDSIMTKYAPGEWPQYGWGQALERFMKDPTSLHNYARSGWSARRFRESGRWEKCIASALGPGDWVIVSFGHNDMNRRRNKPPKNDYSTPEEYKGFLRGFAADAKAKGANIAFATSIAHSSGFGEKDGVMSVDGGATGLGAYVGAMREVAAELKVPLIDLNRYAEVNLPKLGMEKAKSLYMFVKPGEYANYPNGKQDAAHVRDAGAYFYAKAAVEMAREQGLSLSALFKSPAAVPFAPAIPAK